uniref:Uncharacterized protein n=1 Tax=Onchocerca volvulus TaxID=6282 RepID=A0A8R1TM63_ONCVO
MHESDDKIMDFYAHNQVDFSSKDQLFMAEISSEKLTNPESFGAQISPNVYIIFFYYDVLQNCKMMIMIVILVSDSRRLFNVYGFREIVKISQQQLAYEKSIRLRGDVCYFR